MPVDPWDTMRTGRVQSAIAQMRESIAQGRNPSNVLRLGVAYLWLAKYEDASAHFREAIEVSPLSMSDDFGMAGVAEWCLGKSAEAVDLWRVGLKCQYADMAGGVQLPLLLFAASVLQPTAFSRDAAERVLEQRVADARAVHWPGPLGAFVLGQIDEDQLRVQCRCTIGGHPEMSTALHHWKSDFYVGLKLLERGNSIEFAHRMKQMASVSWADFDTDPRLFYAKLRSEELYLARSAVKAH